VSRSLSGLQAVLLGLIVVLGLALAAGGLFFIGGRGWYGAGAFHVRAAFHEIRGVEVGTRVRLKGMDAGEVVEVLAPARMEDAVVLRLLLKGEYRRLLRPDAVVRIKSDGLVGGKVLDILPPVGADEAGAEPVAEDQLLQGDCSDLMADAATTLSGVQAGKGSLSKFVTEDTAHEAFVEMMHQGTKTLAKSQEAIAALQQDADALKRIPLVAGYVEDPSALLERYNCERQRKFFASSDLFEPGRAVLTSAGKAKLDGLAGWIDATKASGSEAVVVAYADPHTLDPKAARVLTRQQSEVVCDYLKTKHGLDRLGWFSSRKATPVGMGAEPPPLAESEPLPPDRVEVQVFIP
jgi:phospholipid/cholesterol/gamma-HCH transport system substrate-binding protein